MIKYVKNIDDVSRYQRGELPANAKKLDAPVTMDEMMKKSIVVFLPAVLGEL